MAMTYAQYINYEMNWLVNYINRIADFNNSYNGAIKDLYSKNNIDYITKSQEMINYENEMKKSYDKAMELYRELGRIADKYKNGSDVKDDIKYFNNKLNNTEFKVYEKATISLEPAEGKYNSESEQGTLTGGAAMPTEPEKADFSDMAQKHWSTRTNINLNNNNPDAQELANIFLASPKNAPESEEYKYIPPSPSCILNSRYNLKGNKKIDNFWSGFAYSKYSTLAKNVSNYSYLKNQLVEHYNSSTGKFDKDKIEVNFDNDLNLHRALGHATILEPTIDRNGYFHGILFDKYDFDLKYKDMYDDIFTTAANDYFWILQETHRNKNFYILAPVTFKW